MLDPELLERITARRADLEAQLTEQAGPAGCDRQGDGDVRLADPGRPEQGGVRLALDEREGGQVLDLARAPAARTRRSPSPVTCRSVTGAEALRVRRLPGTC
jgi:hypothetical protein